MDKVEVRTKALSQALFSLAVAGCETAEVSVVAHAVKVEGIKEDGTVLTLHVWSKDAEDTEASVGTGEQLTEEEIVLLDAGKCPKCQEQLHKGPRVGLAISVSCDAGHNFWVPPKPFIPEYMGTPEAEAVKAEEVVEAEEATPISEAEVQEQTKAEVENAQEEAVKALEEEGEQE